MAEWMKLPVGIEEFEKIRRNGFYYVDKTGLIEELLKQWGEVNLFTRPRRFGKSLHMSMLKSFFSIGSDPGLFDGLKITQDTKLCEEYMGQFPVISISLKGVNAANFQDAFRFLIRIINAEARRLWVLLDGEKLDCIDRKILEDLLDRRMEMDTLVYSLRELSEILERYYGKKVIILIDEYDVPLAKANENGYYDEMVLLIRNLFENALKTNSSLKFAVLTGCLRVAKESIFTGLNHFKIYPITKAVFDEYFGFTDDEVREMLRYYGMEADYETVKEWYDGYRFGKVDVYCPWDVINYCSDHIDDPKLLPQNYWLNTSSNEVIHRFIDSAGKLGRLTRAELERLVNGETVQKEIGQELTYKELYTSMDNLWSTLFMTGYLTQRGEPVGNLYNLAVPNQEIRNIITEHILKSFKEDIGISVRDTFVRRAIRENFYHGILLGILSYKEDWIVRSNRESGDGFSDILITIDGTDTGIVIEVKYAEDGSEEKECRDALKQIAAKRYEASFRQEGVHKIINYGIACNKKKCRVMMEKHD